jgi:hypothetical protein
MLWCKHIQAHDPYANRKTELLLLPSYFVYEEGGDGGMHNTTIKRKVVVADREYVVEVRRSAPRHYDRFASRCYAVVELPGQWQATVPVPDCVRMASHLWYRELIELVHHARRLVARRTSAAA